MVDLFDYIFENLDIFDSNDIFEILEQFWLHDNVGQTRLDVEYYETLPQETQWLIEDRETFQELVKRYLNGDITYEQLQQFELSDYGDAGTRFVEFYNDMMSLAQSIEERPGQKEIFTRGQRVYTKDGKLASVTYDGVVYAPDDTGKLVPKKQPEVRADGGVTILPAETLIDGLNARDINYVRNLFEQQGYEATPEEIKKIVTNSRINDLEGASQGSIEVILSGEVGTYVTKTP